MMIRSFAEINENSSLFDYDIWKEDIWNEVLRKGHSNLVALSCVNQFLNKLIKTYEPEGCFGPAQWIKRKVDVKNVPKIPLKMIQDFDHSKWMLTLVLENINEQPLTLSSLDRFFSDCKNGKDAFKSNYRNILNERGFDDKTVEPFKTHWVILSKDVLGGMDLEKGTRKKSFTIQEKKVKEVGYEMPNLIDVLVSVMLHNLETGKFVYPDESMSGHHLSTYTRVQEKDIDDFPLSVGDFSALGLFITSDHASDCIGASCARKSSHKSLNESY